MRRKIKRKNLKYKTKSYTYDFQQYKTIRSFAESIDTRKASIVKAREDQSNLIEKLVEFNNKSRPKNKEGNDKKRDTYESAYALYKGREITPNAFKSLIFPIKATQYEGRPSDLATRLKMKIKKILYYLHRAKEITQNVYKGIIQNEYHIYEF